MLQHIHAGIVHPQTKVNKAGTPHWQAAGSYAEFNQGPPISPSVAQPSQSPAGIVLDKRLALVMGPVIALTILHAIIFGGKGVAPLLLMSILWSIGYLWIITNKSWRNLRIAELISAARKDKPVRLLLIGSLDVAELGALVVTWDANRREAEQRKRASLQAERRRIIEDKSRRDAAQAKQARAQRRLTKSITTLSKAATGSHLNKLKKAGTKVCKRYQ